MSIYGNRVWQTETYDRIIRDDQEYAFTLQYIAYNPVKAGLCEKPEAYPWGVVGSRVREAGWKPAPQGRINYTVWSDVFICPECAGEVVFWAAAVDKEAGQVRDEFPCPHCSKQLTKRNMERAWITQFDTAIQQTIRQAKQTPVLINYSVGSKRYEKKPDDFDQALIEKIEGMEIEHWFPKDIIPKGDKTGEPLRIGITHIHHFYTKRNLAAFAALLKNINTPLLKVALFGGYTVGLKTARFLPIRWIQKDTGPMKPHTVGTLYIPSVSGEQNWLNIFEKLSKN